MIRPKFSIRQRERVGRARTGQSLYDWVERDMKTLEHIDLGTLYEAYSRQRWCSRDYLSSILANLARAGKLQRVRNGWYRVIHDA